MAPKMLNAHNLKHISITGIVIRVAQTCDPFKNTYPRKYILLIS